MMSLSHLFSFIAAALQVLFPVQAAVSSSATTASPVPLQAPAAAGLGAVGAASQPAPVASPSPSVPQAPPPLPDGLLCIRGPWHGSTHESGGDYHRHTVWPTNIESVFTGAYQDDDPTWDNFMGYPRAYLAPPWVQDLKNLQMYVKGPLERHMRWPRSSLACGV